jgi:hypothetical protein
MTTVKRKKSKAKPKPQIDVAALSRWLNQKGACEWPKGIVLRALRGGVSLREIWDQYLWQSDRQWLARNLDVGPWWEHESPKYVPILRALKAALKPRRVRIPMQHVTKRYGRRRSNETARAKGRRRRAD